MIQSDHKQEVLSILFRSVTARFGLPYSLPCYPLESLGPAATAVYSPAEQAFAREALAGAAHALVLAIHAMLRPPSVGKDGGKNEHPLRSEAQQAQQARAADSGGSAEKRNERLEVRLPLQMLVELSLLTLAQDGALPLRAPPEGAIAYDALLPVLPQIHTLSLQLLHSTVGASHRHALAHLRPISYGLALCWRRTEAAGPRHFRSERLRLASHQLASALLGALGSCVAPSLAPPLMDAALADLAPSDAGERGGGGEDEGEGPRSKREPPPTTQLLQEAAALAILALLENASGLISAPDAARLEAQLLECTSAAAAAARGRSSTSATAHRAHAALLRCMSALPLSGYPLRPRTLPLTLPLMHAPLDAHSRVLVKAASSSLHAVSSWLHPRGVPRSAPIAAALHAPVTTQHSSLQPEPLFGTRPANLTTPPPLGAGQGESLQSVHPVAQGGNVPAATIAAVPAAIPAAVPAASPPVAPPPVAAPVAAPIAATVTATVTAAAATTPVVSAYGASERKRPIGPGDVDGAGVKVAKPALSQADMNPENPLEEDDSDPEICLAGGPD